MGSLALSAIQLAETTTTIAGTGLAQPTPVAPPGFDKVSTVMNWAMWGFEAVCVLGFLACGAAMAVQHFGGGGREPGHHVGRLAWVCFGCILGAAAVPLVNALI